MTHNRSLAFYEVKSRTLTEDGTHVEISTTDHTGFIRPVDQTAGLEPGVTFELETIRGSQITGIRLNEQWLFHHTDEEIAAQDAQFKASVDERRRQELDAHRDEWQRREADLPEPLRARLERFRANGGEAFELSGWGYELVVAELAVLYQASEGADSDDVEKYASIHGTSGNQHDCARFLAAHMDELAEVPAALTPITGDPFYEKAGA